MLYTDLLEAKTILEIDPLDTAEDAKIGFFIEWASQIIEEILGRPTLAYGTYSEIYQGSGSQTLLLKSRPVYPLGGMNVYVDENAHFGSTSGAFDTTTTALEYGRDFCLRMDYKDSRGVDCSRSGILYRIGSMWPRPAVRQRGYLSPWMGKDLGSIKVVYSAGYTSDTLPAGFRMACNMLVAKMRGIFPVGMEVGSESYQDRSMSFQMSRKDYLMSLAKPHILPYRNWAW